MSRLSVARPMTRSHAKGDEACFGLRLAAVELRLSSFRGPLHTASPRWPRPGALCRSDLEVRPMEVSITNVLQPVRLAVSKVEAATKAHRNPPFVTRINPR